MINKIKTIIFSRFKKPNTESFVEERRKICLGCEYNSLNRGRLNAKEIFLKKLSDFYSRITGNKKVDNLGNCTACDICSIYYKTAEAVEECKANPPKWKRIIK